MQKWKHLRLLVYYSQNRVDGLTVDEAFSNSQRTLWNVTTDKLHAHISKLGEEGWELVNAVMWEKDSKFREVYYFKYPLD